MMKRNLEDWLAYLEKLHPSTIDMGLERLKQVAQKLQLIQIAPLIITVTGTNGKGSTCAFIASLLKSEGFRVGVYTSPHLIRYEERIVINDQLVSESSLCQAFELIEQARGDISLTYFEFGTLAAFLLFQQANLEAVVLEVGLGGRLDAVNLVDADIAVITSIGIDHQEWLGDTRESVAFEKAGIFRTSRPAVCGDNNPPHTLLEQAQLKGTPLYVRDKDFKLSITDQHWHWQGINKQGDPLQLPNIPLLNLPIDNAAVALQVFALLDLPWNESKLVHALQHVNVTGRLERHTIDYAGEKRHLLLDVGHNPHAANFLANYLKSRSVAGKRYAVFGLLADKDLEGVITPLTEVIASWAVAPLATSRSNTAEHLAQVLEEKKQHVSTHANIAKAIEAQLASSSPDDEIIVFGSFYVVADALQWLNTFK